MKKIFFIDRDGVINKEIGYLHEISKFEFQDGVFSSLRYILSKGYEIIIITNQSGISRGIYNINDFHLLNDWMLRKFKEHDIEILDVFFCPHGPYDNCHCRKPKNGMFLEAKAKYKIDIENSWVVGDKETDILWGINCNIKNLILVRSGHKIDEENSKAKLILNSIKDIKKLDI